MADAKHIEGIPDTVRALEPDEEIAKKGEPKRELRDAPPIVLIHGLWLNATSWEHWIDRYRASGYEVIAPSWPGLEGDCAALRRHTEGIERLGIAELVTFHAEIIAELERAPIIIGHALGAVIAQILLAEGWGVAGVAVESAPVKGAYRVPWSMLRSAFAGLRHLANRNRAITLTPAQFHYAFTNTISDAAARAAYERYAAPGPGLPLFQLALANLNRRAPTKIALEAQRPPLLVIAGGADHVSPPSVNRAIARLQQRSPSITAYKEFPRRSHLGALGEPGWEEVADFALAWATAPVAIDERMA